MATPGDAVLVPSHRNRLGHGRPAVEEPGVSRAPELGVIDRRHLRARKQRRQARALVTVSVLCLGFALLVAAVGHAIVASDQIRSDALSTKVAAELAVAQNDQLLRAELESPVRIETIAENQLYMVTPSSVSYVVPVKVGETVAQAHRNPADPLSPVRAAPARTTELKAHGRDHRSPQPARRP